MHIAVTGATGFLGRYIVRRLSQGGHRLRCWRRPDSDLGGFEEIADAVQWQNGQLGDAKAAEALVAGTDVVVHGALWRPGTTFRGGEGDVVKFAELNILGTLKLIEAAIRAGVGRFVFISTCAVHEQILEDRPLDESHPLWPCSHYGAHKAAIEKFVHSYGLGSGYPICSLRPTGIYGLARPVPSSKWFDLVRTVVRGQAVTCQRGGKEVHAADVAKAVELLLTAEDVAGQAFNCYDRYVSEWDVAMIAKTVSGSSSELQGEQKRPRHEILTDKLRRLGMVFGGQRLLEQTVEALVNGGNGVRS